MVNTIAPFGFRSFGRLDGGAPTAGLARFFIGSSDTALYFTGDLVALSSAGNANGTNNTNIISAFSGSSGYIALGVFAGCEYYNTTVARTVWSAYFPGNVGSSALVTAYVITDPDQLFIGQVSTTSSACGSSMIGWGIGITGTASAVGNTTTGVSGLSLASSITALAGSTMPFRVVDLYQNTAPPGTNGTSSGSEGGQILVVQPNNWLRRQLTGAST